MFSKNISAFFIIFKGLHGESANLTKHEFLTHKKVMMHTAAPLTVVLWCDKSWNRRERVQYLTRTPHCESYEEPEANISVDNSSVRCHLSFNGKVMVTYRGLTAKRTDRYLANHVIPLTM